MMIRPLPFSPTVVFTAPRHPRRETAPEPDKQEAPVQEVFDRMLAQQREAARQANKLQAPTPAPAPAPEPTAGKQAANEQDPAENTTTNPAAIRSAHRSRAQAGGIDTKPAQIDTKHAQISTTDAQIDTGLPAPDKALNQKHAAYEAGVLAKLFKTATNAPLPPKLPPIGPEGPPEEEPAPLPLPTDKYPPGPPGQFNPVPPVIECPAELPMLDHMAAASGNGAAEALAARSDTQALQGRAAVEAPSAQPLAGQTASSTVAAAAIERPADVTSTPAWAADRIEAAAQSPGSAAGPAIGAAPAGIGSGAPVATPARSATLDARPGTEAFQAKFSAQVAVWVREGVQEAQLQLNPADMGPVRVAILLEGAAAQVNFSAEHALTRQALEQALPSLAGSLAEAGFTLAGGGVFDQPQQPGRSTGDDGERSRARVQGEAGDGDARTNAERAGFARPRGVVDLVA